MPDVFISYSRKDQVFAQRLFFRLAQENMDSWADWDNIPYSAEWWLHIKKGIEEASNFVCIISPSYVTSKICNDELLYARQLSKRIIPVIRREIYQNGVYLPEIRAELFGKAWVSLVEENLQSISKLNYIFFRKKNGYDCKYDDVTKTVTNPECDGVESDADEFEGSFKGLVSTAQTDLEHLTLHTRLLIRAQEWERGAKDGSFLLRLSDLSRAEAWLVSSENKQPAPLPLHKQYIQASHAEENERVRIAQEQAKRIHHLAEAEKNAREQQALSEQAKAQAEEARTRAEVERQQAQQAKVISDHARKRALRVLTGVVLGALLIVSGVIAFTDNQVNSANLRLTAVAEQVQTSEAQIESLQIAALASGELQRSKPLVSSLLAIRSLQIAYTTAADEVLSRALSTFSGVHALRGHTDSVNDATFSPDDRFIVTASSDGTAIIWNAETGEPVHTLEAHSAPVNSAAYSPDGRSIITASSDRTAIIWNADTKERVYTLGPYAGAVTTASFSPDSQFVLTGSSSRIVFVHNAETGDFVRELRYQIGPVLSASFSPDGNRIVTGGLDRVAIIWASDTGSQERSLDGHSDGITSVAYSSGGQFLVDDHSKGYGRRKDGRSTLRPYSRHVYEVSCIRQHHCGVPLVTASKDHTAIIWDIEGKQHQGFMAHRNWVLDIESSPDGRYFATASADGVVSIWETSSNNLVLTLRGHSRGVYSVAYSSDGQHVITGSLDGSAIIWNTSTGRQERQLTAHTDVVNGVDYSPDGRFVVTASWDGRAIIWNADNGEQVRVLESRVLYGVAYSPDGRFIVTSSGDSTATIWNVQTGEQVHVLRGHGNAIRNVAYSPDGTHIVTVSWDRTAIIWDATSGTLVRVLQGHTYDVHSVAYSPDGQFITTASGDNRAIVWDAITGDQIRVFYGHSDTLMSVTYLTNGGKIVTGSADGYVVIWESDVTDYITSACDHLIGFRDLTTEESMQFQVNHIATCSQS
jgi:WD40 repeat protein